MSDSGYKRLGKSLLELPLTWQDFTLDKKNTKSISWEELRNSKSFAS